MRMRANGKKFLSILTTDLDTTTRNVTAVFKSCGKSGQSPCWLSSRTQEQGVGGNHYQLCRLHLHLCTATLLYSWIGGKRCLIQGSTRGRRRCKKINPLIMLIQSGGIARTHAHTRYWTLALSTRHRHCRSPSKVHVDPHTRH